MALSKLCTIQNGHFPNYSCEPNRFSMVTLNIWVIPSWCICFKVFLPLECPILDPFKSDAFKNSLFQLCILVEEMALNGGNPHAWGSLKVPRCQGSKYSILAYFWPFLPFSLGSGFHLGLKSVCVRLI